MYDTIIMIQRLDIQDEPVERNAYVFVLQADSHHFFLSPITVVKQASSEATFRNNLKFSTLLRNQKIVYTYLRIPDKLQTPGKIEVPWNMH